MNNTDFRYHAANAHNKNMLTLLPGRQKSPGEICFPMHWQERMELLRVYEGQLEIDFGDEVRHIRAGQLAIVGPRQSHRGVAGPEGVRYMVILLDVSGFYGNIPGSPGFLEAIAERSVVFCRSTEDSDITGVFDRLTDIINLPDTPAVLESISLTYRLFGLFYQRCVIRQEPAAVADGKFREILSYIDAHYRERITASSLSRHFGYSEGYLCRKFRKITGSTLTAYITDIRLNHAMHMLYETTEEIRRISDLCGFANERYFSTCFRRRYGTTPSQQRKAHQKTPKLTADTNS